MDKSTVVLPSTLKGQVNLLLLSWARDQQAQLATWTAAGQALEHTDSNAWMYTVLAIANENFIFRWWNNASLRAAQTDPQLLPYTLALYTDKNKLRRALGIPNESKPVALLIDRSGKILWEATGPSTPAKREALLAAAHGA